MHIEDIVPGLAAGVGIDLSPDGKTAYYAEWSIGQLSKVDVWTGMVTTVMTGLVLPQDVEVDWSTGEIFVSQRTGSVVQVWPGERARTIATPGGAPHQLALVRQGGKRFLYTVCFDSGRLVRINLATHAVTTIASGLGHPIGLVINQTHKFAYVTEQDTGCLRKIRLTNGSKAIICTGLKAPFFLAWDRPATGIFCVQRDPANSLLRLHLGPPVTASTVAAGLAWRPSGVSPSSDNKLIYICADRELELISFNGAPVIKRPPPGFEIHSIQFNYKGSQAVALKDHLAGTAVPVPEYVRGVRNGPAAYTRGSLPHVRVVLRKRPGFVPGTYTIGATGSLGGIRWKTVTPTFNPSGLSNEIDFEFMWPLPGTVQKADVSLDWYARRTPGPSIPVAIGSAVHRLYILIGRPTAPWIGETPWVAAMELACGWAAGSATADEAAAGITAGYNGSGKVSYDTVSGATMYGSSTFSLSEMIERLNGGVGLGNKVNCTDSADTVSTLANIVGCDLWQSRMSSTFGFDLNPLIAIGYNTWAIPFSGSFSYHEVAWKGGCTQSDNVFDGCLQVDGDADPTSAPHTPLLPTNMLFGDCAAMNYRLRLCPPSSAGCGSCNPQPGSTRQRRPIN
jgi:DNA-binding beta-propeller fold protein YncE